MTDIDYSIPMDPNREDSAGYSPDANLLGKDFVHWKTKRVYRVVGFVWDGERDLWLIRHVDLIEAQDSIRSGHLGAPRVNFVRSFENFFELLFHDATVGTDPSTRMTRI